MKHTYAPGMTKAEKSSARRRNRQQSLQANPTEQVHTARKNKATGYIAQDGRICKTYEEKFYYEQKLLRDERKSS